MRTQILLLALALASCSHRSSPSNGTDDQCPSGAEPADALAFTTPTLFKVGGPVESSLTSVLGWSREQIGFDPQRTSRTGYFPADPATTLPHVRALQTQALDLPAWQLRAVDDVSRWARSACARSAGVVLEKTLQALDARNQMKAQGLEPLAQEPEDLDAALAANDPLLAALREVYATNTGWTDVPASTELDDAEVRALASKIGTDTERALARVVLGMARAEKWRLAAVRAWYPASPDRPDLADLASVFRSRGASLERIRSFDYEAMGRAGLSLARAVGQLAAQVAAHPLPNRLSVQFDTPLGQIVLDGRTSDDDYQLDAPALVVDQGGNDTYHGAVAGPAKPSIPLSVVIDVAGSDTYAAGDAECTQGAGVLSFGFLVDLGGDDTYEATRYAQGVGVFGVGALYDAGGRDVYTARLYAQGAGQYGSGALIDLRGDDEYHLLSYGQGYGAVRSTGLLLDLVGNDLYDADDVNIDNPSPQTDKHNISLAQGAGFGYRGNDWPDTMSGGTGMLVDLGGNDRYGCGVFCQGTGYWFGQGLLYDREGDDQYTGAWYVQGGVAHFAIGALIDEAGDDVYRASINMSQGAGHDGSIGLFVDAAGDDQYGLTSLSHGASNDVGIGIFVDALGKDVYGVSAETTGNWFGQTASGDFSGTARQGVRALGAFLDIAGQDEYRAGPAEAGNGKSWKLAGSGWAPPEQRGVGIDGE